MRHRKLGDQGPEISAVVLGTINLGTEIGPDESFMLLDAAADGGVTMIDTADVYGRRPGEAYTELLIGKWFATRPHRRDEVAVATKIGMPFTADPHDRGLTARHLRRGCENALARLGVERIDLLQLHQPDPATPLEETWSEIARLQREGKVGEAGTSNHAPADIRRNHAAALRAGARAPVSEQCAYNLLSRTPENDTVEVCTQLGMGLLAWSPLARGLLGGMIARRDAGEAGGRLMQPAVLKALGRHEERLREYEKECAARGSAPADVALAWLLGRPGVRAAVIGPRTVEQLASALSTVDTKLDEPLRDRLDVLFPPGTPARGEPYAHP